MSDLTLKDAILGMLSARASGPDHCKIHASDFKKVSIYLWRFMSLLIVIVIVIREYYYDYTILLQGGNKNTLHLHRTDYKLSTS